MKLKDMLDWPINIVCFFLTVGFFGIFIVLPFFIGWMLWSEGYKVCGVIAGFVIIAFYCPFIKAEIERND